MVIDHSNKEFTGIMINRDTVTDIQIYGSLDDYWKTTQAQIALAHSYGKNESERCINTRWAVENLFYGISIDNYISFTMEAVPILNDLVGGVPVEIKDDFTCVDESLVTGSTIILKKEQALTYIRARKGMNEETNLNRMERQKDYLESFVQCAKACARGNTVFYQKVFDATANYVVTDCDSSEIIHMDKVLREYNYEKIINLTGESKSGTDYMEYYVDETALEKIIMELFYKKCL